MSDSPGPVRAFWNAALLVLAACVLLWLAVQVIESIWIWLLVGAIIAVLGWALVVWWRWRRSRW